MKSVVFVMSLVFAATSFAAGTKPLAERTVVICPTVEGVVASVVRAQFENQNLALYIKVASADGKLGPYYQKFTSLSSLGDTATVYESQDYQYTYYSFATGKKPTVAIKSKLDQAVTCEALGE